MTDHSKPKWEDAPEWANWLAQDESGEWFFFGSPPKQHQAHQIWMSSTFCKKAGEGRKNENWRDTVEQRPKHKQEQQRTVAFHMTPDELFSIGDYSEIVQAVMLTPADFVSALTEAQIGELVKALPDKVLRDECRERGIEVNPFEREE